MVKRHELSDKQWEQLKPLLPPQKQDTGRPSEDHRKIINGILWRLKTGVSWRDIPERYGPWSTIYSRFFRWKRSGIWDQIFSAILSQEDAQGCLDWDTHYVDSTIIRAHQHASGLKKRGRKAKHSGTARAGTPPRFI